jgi:hypothetical protein
LHPTGSFVFASFDDPVDRSDGISEADGRIKWKGLSGADYRTDVVLQGRRVSGKAELRVRVAADTAILPYNQNCRLLSWTPVD